MDTQETLTALRELERPHGTAIRCLRIGTWRFLLVGLDEELAAALDHRWGGFLYRDPDDQPKLVVRILRGEAELGLGTVGRGERYRIETSFEQDTPLVRSYHFALCPDEESEHWRCALMDPVGEPADRVVENAIRYLIARTSVMDGGFALHAASVEREGRAFLFAGPSRSGKTTAVRLSSPGRSLGDDYAVVLPGGGHGGDDGGWVVPAVPFDNSEAAPAHPAFGPFPIQGIWRLFHAQEPRVEHVPVAAATASLLSCTTFPWTLSDLTAPMIGHVRSFVDTGRFGHLHFRISSDFWPLIDPPA